MKNATEHSIAVIPGDGIGREVIPEGVRVLEAVGARHGLRFKWQEFPWSCDWYQAHGKMRPDDAPELLRKYDAIYFGAVGNPAPVPDHIAVWGLLIDFRRIFGMVQTGKFTPWGTKAWFAASRNLYDHWRGDGKIDKWQVNGKIYQPLGSNGDFISPAGAPDTARSTTALTSSRVHSTKSCRSFAAESGGPFVIRTTARRPVGVSSLQATTRAPRR